MSHNTMQNNKPRIKKSVWLPTLLAIYLLGMTIYFGTDLINNGEIARLILVFLADALVIALLYFLLRKQGK